jgi:hypothetical protein
MSAQPSLLQAIAKSMLSVVCKNMIMPLQVRVRHLKGSNPPRHVTVRELLLVRPGHLSKGWSLLSLEPGGLQIMQSWALFS